jgi:hypothetical protein
VALSPRPGRALPVALAALVLATAAVMPAAASDRERWQDYQIIVWQPQSAPQYRALKEIGVTGGALQANRAEPSQFDAARAGAFRTAGLPWYVENIATDFYAAYHRWTPDHVENFRFNEIKSRYAADKSDPVALRRAPSLSDPQWLQRIRDRLMATVRAHRADHPLFYNLGDETGIADLAAYWDFDFSAPSLAAFRRSLRHSYPSLAALNRQWGTDFAAWDAVVPMTTDAAMRRRDGNFSGWADFKAWMDSEFAHSLRRGTDAIHAADRDAVAAIEGGQITGWGGYDYVKLATAVDAIELYDSGNNVDIVRSLNPDLIMLTSLHAVPSETHHIWHELLHGTRGLILWEPKSELAAPDGTLGHDGAAMAPLFRTLRSGIGAAIINSRAESDAVAILESPASMRTQWMLDWQPKGDAWSRLDAAAQYDDNALRSAVGNFWHGIERLGLQPRFVTSELIAAGELERRRTRVLVLPHAIALSPVEAQTIRRFVAHGGVVIADREPGLYDQHSRKLSRSPLHDLFPGGTTTSVSLGKGKAVMLEAPEPANPGDDALQLRAILAAAGVNPAYPLHSPAGDDISDVETHRFRNGAVTVIALQRDLRPAVASTGDASRAMPQTGDERVVLTLPQPLAVTDMRDGKSLGRTSRIELALDPVTPTLLVVSPHELPAPSIAAPPRLGADETTTLRFALAAPSPTTVNILHAEVIDPAGRIRATKNIVMRNGAASYRLATAGGPAGDWTIRITDTLSGKRASSKIAVAEGGAAAR